jgi:hypothetical protein
VTAEKMAPKSSFFYIGAQFHNKYREVDRYLRRSQVASPKTHSKLGDDPVVGENNWTATTIEAHVGRR